MNYTEDGVSFYDGEWVNNIRHGLGVRQYPSQNIYQGMWFNNVRHGEGTMRWLDRDQMYNGQWENGTQVCKLFFFSSTFSICNDFYLFTRHLPVQINLCNPL